MIGMVVWRKQHQESNCSCWVLAKNTSGTGAASLLTLCYQRQNPALPSMALQAPLPLQFKCIMHGAGVLPGVEHVDAKLNPRLRGLQRKGADRQQETWRLLQQAMLFPQLPRQFHPPALAAQYCLWLCALLLQMSLLRPLELFPPRLQSLLPSSSSSFRNNLAAVAPSQQLLPLNGWHSLS